MKSILLKARYHFTAGLARMTDDPRLIKRKIVLGSLLVGLLSLPACHTKKKSMNNTCYLLLLPPPPDTEVSAEMKQPPAPDVEAPTAVQGTEEMISTP